MFYSNDLTDVICKEEKLLIPKIGRLLWNVFERVEKNEKYGHARYECHSICRAISLEITDGSLKLVDGVYVVINAREDKKLFLAEMEHSWFVTKWGNILDPYPIGLMSIAPILVANQGGLKSFMASRYMPSEKVTERVATRDMWRRARVLHRLFQSEV